MDVVYNILAVIGIIAIIAIVVACAVGIIDYFSELNRLKRDMKYFEKCQREVNEKLWKELEK